MSNAHQRRIRRRRVKRAYGRLFDAMFASWQRGMDRFCRDMGGQLLARGMSLEDTCKALDVMLTPRSSNDE